jgi:hypothetical protein
LISLALADHSPIFFYLMLYRFMGIMVALLPPADVPSAHAGCDGLAGRGLQMDLIVTAIGAVVTYSDDPLSKSVTAEGN